MESDGENLSSQGMASRFSMPTVPSDAATTRNMIGHPRFQEAKQGRFQAFLAPWNIQVLKDFNQRK